jgi:hypothetical protein
VAKNAGTTPPAPQPQRAAEVLLIIASLSGEERAALFRALARRPDLTAEYAVLPKEIVELLGRSHTDLRTWLVEMGRIVAQYDKDVARYKRGPKARANVGHRREDFIRRCLAAGTRDPRKILEALRKDTPDLGNVKIKTIQNILAGL